jgi:hypothetical protein
VSVDLRGCQGGKYGCGNPPRFVARHDEPGQTVSIVACGKHIAAALESADKDGRFIVAVIQKGKS